MKKLFLFTLSPSQRSHNGRQACFSFALSPLTRLVLRAQNTSVIHNIHSKTGTRLFFFSRNLKTFHQNDDKNYSSNSIQLHYIHYFLSSFKKIEEFLTKIKIKITVLIQFNFTIYTICYRLQNYYFNVQVNFLFTIFLNIGNVFWVVDYV